MSKIVLHNLTELFIFAGVPANFKVRACLNFLPSNLCTILSKPQLSEHLKDDVIQWIVTSCDDMTGDDVEVRTCLLQCLAQLCKSVKIKSNVWNKFLTKAVLE